MYWQNHSFSRFISNLHTILMIRCETIHSIAEWLFVEYALTKNNAMMNLMVSLAIDISIRSRPESGWIYGNFHSNFHSTRVSPTKNTVCLTISSIGQTMELIQLISPINWMKVIQIWIRQTLEKSGRMSNKFCPNVVKSVKSVKNLASWYKYM